MDNYDDSTLEELAAMVCGDEPGMKRRAGFGNLLPSFSGPVGKTSPTTTAARATAGYTPSCANGRKTRQETPSASSCAWPTDGNTNNNPPTTTPSSNASRKSSPLKAVVSTTAKGSRSSSSTTPTNPLAPSG